MDKMTPTNDAPVTVEQCDRDRAWPFRPYLLTDTVATAASWNAGRYDAERVIQAFAAHRLAALASAPAGDALADAGKPIAPAGDGHVLMPRHATRAMVEAADACTDAYSAYNAMVEVAHVR